MRDRPVYHGQFDAVGERVQRLADRLYHGDRLANGAGDLVIHRAIGIGLAMLLLADRGTAHQTARRQALKFALHGTGFGSGKSDQFVCIEAPVRLAI